MSVSSHRKMMMSGDCEEQQLCEDLLTEGLALSSDGHQLVRGQSTLSGESSLWSSTATY